MNVSRRGFLTTAAATLLVPYVRPAKRRTIDLMRFCGDDEYPWRKYDTRLPHAAGEYTYATNLHICVRVGSLAADVFDHEGTPPPFHRLLWDHDDLTGWKPVRPEILMADDSYCPACDGSGVAPGSKDLVYECGRCDGFGCHRCDGSGRIIAPEAVRCSQCNGQSYGVFPAIVRIGDQYFERGIYDRWASVGESEYRPGDTTKNLPTLFRFDSGLGLAMPLDTKTALSRIRQ